MAILSKERKPDNFELHNFLKFSFTNIGVLHSIFVDCKLFLESNSPNILALCETNLNGSIDSGKLFVRGNLPLFWNDSTTHILGLAVYVKEGLPFTWDLLQILIFLTGFTSLSVLLLFCLSVTFFIVMHRFLFCFIKHRWGSLNQPIC